MSRLKLCCLLLAGLWAVQAAHAEPYLAVRSGLKCAMCHTNPTGGGKRNIYGNTYAQTTLPGRRAEAAPGSGAGDDSMWTGRINDYMGVGADLRTELTATDADSEPNTETEFNYEESLLYLQFDPVPGRVSLYTDTRLGPGGAQTREAYGLLRFASDRYFVKAGRFFLPFGWRLEDDTALTRSVTGVSYETPDDGVEFGMEHNAWSTQLAVTNGAGGGAEQDNEKRVIFNAAYTQPGWRIGASASNNETDAGTRDMTAVYAGLRTGIVSWLFEYDWVRDTISDDLENEQQVTLIEANTLLSKGNNLKLTYEILTPDEDMNLDDTTRTSLVWEHFPIQYLQMSMGLRTREGPQNDPTANRDTAFMQLHVFF